MEQDQTIFLVTQRDPEENQPGIDGLYHTGTVAKIKNIAKLPKNIVRVMVEGVGRGHLLAVQEGAGYLLGQAEISEEEKTQFDELTKTAMVRALQDLLGRYGQINQKFGKDMMQQLMTISDVETLVAEAGAHLPLFYEERQRILDAENFSDRYDALCTVIANEAEIIQIRNELQQKVKEQNIIVFCVCKQLLIDSIKDQMRVDEHAYDYENETSVVLLIGVNGVGKTTSVGKLAGQFKNNGKKVILAAADTFRAAAIEQLTEWANRAGVELISGQEGGDPAAVVYDAVNAAKARKADILLCDTAGRLHNKKNLMEELRKINRIIEREYPDAHRETLVVLDGTTGQNALAQAKQFGEVADITGIILTKLDGTAKGGIAIAIQSELHVPVKYIGIGEQIDDLQKFDADQFVDALFE